MLGRNLHRQTSQIVTVPAPIGGWNARDPLGAMPTTDAIQLDNWIPGTQGLQLRNGYASHVTGLGASVETLMEYSGISGTNKMFGAASTAIYDVTSAGAVGAAAVSTLTNARWQHTMFATSGGNFLVIANGADSVRNYDGSSWTTPSITGATSSTFIHVTPHASRLWFVQKDTLKAWYLGASAISGAATALDIGPFCRKGGYLMAAASWTRDGGSGPDDVLVFITSKGQAVIYSGSDPSSASTWTLVGVFNLPEPVGRRCLIKVGADLAYLSERGLLPLSAILPAAETAAPRIALTDKITNAFQTAHRAFGSLFGWQIIEYPHGALLICNVPTGSGTTSEQFVANVVTGAWCRFTGLNAISLSMMGDHLYFGTSGGTVYKYGVDYIDVATPITGYMFPAFNSFDTPNKKQFLAVRPNYLAVEGTQPPLTLRTDYDTTAASLTTSTVPSGGDAWDEEFWDEASWGPNAVPITEWQQVAGIGHVGSFISSIASQTEITLNNIDVQYQVGGVL